LRLTTILLALALSADATAADVTDLAPKYRGDVRLRYDGLFQQVGLEEDDLTVGIRNFSRHDVTLRGEVSVLTGLGVTIALPITAQQRIWYPSAREMLFQPISGEGSYVDGPELPEDQRPDVRGKGVQGVWIGLAAQPFRQDYAKGFPLDARFDFAFRTPAPNGTLYGEKRGGAPGGWGILLSGAFSARRGPAEPYLRLSWQYETAVHADVLYPNGTTAKDVPIQPSSRVDARAGAELIALEKPKGDRFAIDLWASFGYRSPETYPSGFWLPSVLPSSRGLGVVRGEYVIVGAGLGFQIDVTKWVGIRLGGEGQYFTPHRVENLYEVRTDAPSFQANWTAQLIGRIRTKDDRK
jgi:hypothetical protein